MAFGATMKSGMLNLTLLILFLLVTYNDKVISSTLPKSFRRATNQNGTNICPSGGNNTPYATIAVDQLDLPKSSATCSPPPDTLCSWKCTMDPSCTSFSWKANTNECEFYKSAPRTCTIVADCIHFERKICGYASCETGVFSLTADNVVKHLYIDGVELTNLPNANHWDKTDSVSLPSTASLIAVEIYNDPDYFGGLLASSSTILTDGTWKVSTACNTSDWMKTDFDDSTWDDASTYGYNGGRRWYPFGICDSAQWIAAKNKFESTVFFRYHLKLEAD